MEKPEKWCFDTDEMCHSNKCGNKKCPAFKYYKKQNIMSKNKICQMCFEVEAMPESNFCEECEEIMDYTYVGKDGHLDLDKALEEIQWLYKEYGKEDNNNLTLGAIGLKNKVINFVEEIKKLG